MLFSHDVPLSSGPSLCDTSLTHSSTRRSSGGGGVVGGAVLNAAGYYVRPLGEHTSTSRASSRFLPDRGDDRSPAERSAVADLLSSVGSPSKRQRRGADERENMDVPLTAEQLAQQRQQHHYHQQATVADVDTAARVALLASAMGDLSRAGRAGPVAATAAHERSASDISMSMALASTVSPRLVVQDQKAYIRSATTRRSVGTAPIQMRQPPPTQTHTSIQQQQQSQQAPPPQPPQTPVAAPSSHPMRGTSISDFSPMLSSQPKRRAKSGGHTVGHQPSVAHNTAVAPVAGPLSPTQPTAAAGAAVASAPSTIARPSTVAGIVWHDTAAPLPSMPSFNSPLRMLSHGGSGVLSPAAAAPQPSLLVFTRDSSAGPTEQQRAATRAAAGMHDVLRMDEAAAEAAAYDEQRRTLSFQQQQHMQREAPLLSGIAPGSTLPSPTPATPYTPMPATGMSPALSFSGARGGSVLSHKQRSMGMLSPIPSTPVAGATPHTPAAAASVSASSLSLTSPTGSAGTPRGLQFTPYLASSVARATRQVQQAAQHSGVTGRAQLR